MKKQVLALIGASAVSLFAQGTLWPATAAGMNGTQVLTGGYFYGYSDGDDVNGTGKSSYAWVNGIGEYNDPQLSADGSLPIALTIAAGATDLFAAMGVNFGETDLIETDFSAQTGFCVTYASTGAAKFELKSAALNELAKPDRYNTPVMDVPLAATGTALNIPFASLKQATDWGALARAVPMADITKRVTSIAFKVEKAPARTVVFAVGQLGYSGECTAQAITIPTVGIATSKVSAKTFAASLVGRTLSFSNLGKANVKVELVSLQGKVVASGIVNAAHSSMNLSKLSSGVYVVRALDKKVNFSKMVTLN